MAPISISRLARSAETVYAVLALFALTQGPVYRVWTASALSIGTSPEPSLRHVYFASFIATQIPAVLLVGRFVTMGFLRLRSTQFLLALCTWLGLSVTWSTLARHSLPEFVALVVTTIFGIYLVTRHGMVGTFRIVVYSMSLGAGVSLFAIWRGWVQSVSLEEGYWIGIYYNRNSLAPVIAVLVLAVVGLRITEGRENNRWSLRFVMEISLLVTAFYMLWRTGSQTSWFALAATVVFITLWWILQRAFPVRLQRPKWWSPATLSLILCSLAIFVGLRIFGDVFGAQQETAVFSSRGPLWSLSWSGIQLKPLFGWGWMAAWHTPEFFKQGEWWAIWDTRWSHSGYHDVLLGGGAIAGLLFAAYLLSAFRNLDQVDTRERLPRIMLATFVLAAATQESFLIGSHFLWSLLIAALTVDVTTRMPSIEQDNSAESSPRFA